MAKRFNIGFFFMLLVAVNLKMCMPDVEGRCILCVTGETAETQGVITKVDVRSYGPKGYNDYNICYTYSVDGKAYSGMAVDSGKGLGYLENHAVVVDYSVKDHSCSCARNMECPAENGLFASVTAAVLFLVGLAFIIFAVRGISGAAAVLRYGEIVNGVAAEITEEIRSNPFNFAGVAAIHSRIRQYRVTCSYSTNDGKKNVCVLYAKNKDVIRTGDSLKVIYDPNLPGNAIVVEALSRFIETKPPLS